MVFITITASIEIAAGGGGGAAQLYIYGFKSSHSSAIALMPDREVIRIS